MTRINANLDPSILLDQHLMAEYRELPMVYAALRKSLKTKSIQQVLNSIPKKFTLNTGHVTFFYDKLLFLQNRCNRLYHELLKRGYDLAEEREFDLSEFDECFFNDWEMSPNDKKVILERIFLRHSEKPNWYRMNGDVISCATYKFLIENVL